MPNYSICLQRFHLLGTVLFFILSHFTALPAQDTLYVNKFYDQVSDSAQAEVIEIHKRDAKDSSIYLVMTTLKNGNTLSVLKYSDYSKGILTGRCRYWYPNGGVCKEANYVQGKQQGIEQTWYPSGVLKRKVLWDNDTIVNGVFFEEDGSPKTEVYREDLYDYEISKLPQFIGGEPALQAFLRTNLRYPTYAREHNIQGNVSLSFVVDKKGMITNAQVIQSPDPSLTKEGLRIISIMPRWEPGSVGGVPVRVRFTLPLRFFIE